MSPLYRNLALAVAALGAAGWIAARLGLFDPAPPALASSPAGIARGRELFRARCRHCHDDVPLERRIAGWSAARAWDALGRLPELSPVMPPFHGTPEERRDLALFLAEMGAAASGAGAPSP